MRRSAETKRRGTPAAPTISYIRNRFRNERILHQRIPTYVALTLFLALVIAGLSLRGQFGESDQPRIPEGPAGRSPVDSSQLTSRMAEAALERKELSERLAKIDQEVAQIRALLGQSNFDPAALTLPGDLPPGLTEAASQEGELPITGNNLFSDDALLLQGIPPAQVARLRERWIRQELDTMAISDRALREGYFLQKRHTAELFALDHELRQDLKDDEYDRYLFAQKKPNRLSTGEVFKGSSAYQAGLRRGDVILQYDGKRIFNHSELLLATSRGERGESVEIEILRNGRRETLFIDRGPFGALTKPFSDVPLPY